MLRNDKAINGGDSLQKFKRLAHWQPLACQNQTEGNFSSWPGFRVLDKEIFQSFRVIKWVWYFLLERYMKNPKTAK